MRPYQRDRNVSSGDEVFFEAPLRGLKTDSSLLGLAPQYAYKLDNMVVQPDSLVTRRGYSVFATGITGTLPSLLPYNNATTSKLFVKTSTGVYDVSSTGAVGSAVAASTKGDAVSTNFATSGGQFLFVVNGTDSPLLYDGSAWTALTDVSTPALTGVTPTILNHVTPYRNRLFFLSDAFLGFYYLPIDSVGGAVTPFRIGSICPKGGRAVGQATWTVDGGEGQDDFYVVATSEGEVAVFFGNNPSELATWDLRGVYQMGKPIGRNCFMKLGGDLLYLSEDGVVPLSAALVTASVNKNEYLSRNIAPSLVADIALHRSAFGWGMLTVPERALVIVNTPSNPSKQYVYNTQSRAWSTFSGWDALSWATYGTNVYFVDSAGRLCRAFDTAGDNGELIRWCVRSAFNRFKKMRQIRPILVRPFVAQDNASTYTFGFASDFESNYIGNTIAGSGGIGGLWDSGLWDIALWGGGFYLQRRWNTVAARGGVALSVEVSGASATGATIYLGADLKLSEHGLVF